MKKFNGSQLLFFVPGIDIYYILFYFSRDDFQEYSPFKKMATF